MATIMITVCMPVGGPCPVRAANARFVTGWWGRHDFTVVHGTDDSVPYSRSAARNRAAAQAAEDVLVFGDADTLGPVSQVEHAVQVARATGRMAIAYDRGARLTEAQSDSVRAGGPLPDLVPGSRANTVGGLVAVPRALWELIGGYDERLQGWGVEDRAFWLAATALGGPVHRVPGAVWHLWHPRTPDRERRAELVELGMRYKQAAGHTAQCGLLPAHRGPDTPDPAALMALLAEPGGPRHGRP